MKKHFLHTLFFFSSLFLFNACEDDIEIITNEATNITNYTANVTCRVKGDVSLADSECGVLYSPNKGDVMSGAGFEAPAISIDGNTFSSALYFTTTEDIAAPGTKYFDCGYVLYHNNYYYGNVRSLRTAAK